jgi:CDP-glucose 4,6-dehydratase
MELLHGKYGKMDLGKYFKNKNIFISGHTGFKGSWLLTWLHLLGANIKGYALEPLNSFDLYNVINGNDLCSSIIADITDKEKLKYEIINFKPDFIFHLAAQPLVIESYKNPLYTFEVNTLGTANILEAMRCLAKPCIAVMVTTDKVYHNYESGQAYKEDDRLGGYDPYSASKGAAEIIIDCYKQSFFNQSEFKNHHKSISVARAGNVIGGGDWSKYRIIPDIVRALTENKDIEIRNPSAIRPWQHVLEPIRGYLKLAALQSVDPILYGDSYNFGPKLSDNLTVKQIVEASIKIWGSGNYVISSSQNQVHEAGLLQLDISKAIDKLDWIPKFTSLQAINKTVNWYKKFHEEENNAYNLVCEDINKINIDHF